MTPLERIAAALERIAHIMEAESDYEALEPEEVPGEDWDKIIQHYAHGSGPMEKE